MRADLAALVAPLRDAGHGELVHVTEPAAMNHLAPGRAGPVERRVF